MRVAYYFLALGCLFPLGCGSSTPVRPTYSDAVQAYEVELITLEEMEVEQQQKRDKVILLIEKNTKEFNSSSDGMTFEEAEKLLNKLVDVERAARQEL